MSIYPCDVCVCSCLAMHVLCYVCVLAHKDGIVYVHL